MFSHFFDDAFIPVVYSLSMFCCRTLINLSLIFNLGSGHTSMGMPSSPGALPSFICLIAMLTSASEKMSVSMLGLVS